MRKVLFIELMNFYIVVFLKNIIGNNVLQLSNAYVLHEISLNIFSYNINFLQNSILYVLFILSIEETIGSWQNMLIIVLKENTGLSVSQNHLSYVVSFNQNRWLSSVTQCN